MILFDEQMRANSHRIMFKTKVTVEIRIILTGVHTQSIEYILESLKVSQTRKEENHFVLHFLEKLKKNIPGRHSTLTNFSFINWNVGLFLSEF